MTKHLLLKTIAAMLLAGCGTTSSQKPAEAQSVHTAAKVEVPGIPIHQAAWKGDMEIVQQHLAAGTGVDAKNKWGSTALHYTARGGKVAVAGLLISSSADVNARDADGLTPLHFAASAGHGEVAKLLIAKGADVKAKGVSEKRRRSFQQRKKIVGTSSSCCWPTALTSMRRMPSQSLRWIRP
jgi:ankyrin repeat protein